MTGNFNKNLMRPIRNSAKALIIQAGRILLIKLHDNVGDWYGLPGGGQQTGETLPETLQRECREEIGVEVQVGSLQYIREYISWHHEFANAEEDVHQIEFMFNCSISQNENPSLGPNPDTRQTAVVWMSLEALPGHRLYPQALTPFLVDSKTAPGPIYLGDVN